MTKKKEKEEDIIKAEDIEKEVKEEIRITEDETEAKVIDKKVHEELIRTAEKYLDNWKRCQADFENYKKDKEKKMGEFRKFANMDIIMQTLPIIDNFESSLAHIPENEKESPWVQGILHIKKQLEDILKSDGVKEIEVKEGDEFNPEIHEAIKQEVGSEELEVGKLENKIKKVMQKGYKIEDKIIRPTRVVVK